MDYDKIDAVNWSTLKHMRTSPLHYKHALTAPRKETDLMRIGTAGHALVLEPDSFSDVHVCYEGRRQGKAWDAFKEEHAGKRILTAAEWVRAVGIGTAVLADPTAMHYLGSGIKEAPITWTDRETGIRCKGRPDVAGRILADMKTTTVIDPYRFAVHAARMGYPEQLAFYRDGLAENGVPTEPEPIVIVVQSEPPFDLVVYRVPEHVVDAGRARYRQLLQRLSECLASDHWPGVARDEQWLEVPEWFYDQGGTLDLTMDGESLEVA